MKVSAIVSHAVKNQYDITSQPKQQISNPVMAKDINLNNMPNSTSYLVNFKGNEVNSSTVENVKKYVNTGINNVKEIRIPDLLELDENVHIPKSMNESLGINNDVNPNGLHIEISQKIDSKQYKITDDKGKVVFLGEVHNGILTPEVIYKHGKFKPEITIKDGILEHKRAKMLEGSSIIADGFSLVMPGKYVGPNEKIHSIKPGENSRISFSGNIITSVLTKEQNTKNAIEDYYKNKFYEDVIPGKYRNEVVDNQVQGIMPAGGFGERFYNLTREFENKPTYPLPTSNAFRMIGTTLNMFAAAGIIDGNPRKDKVIYLSQKHELKPGKNVVHTNMYKTDGGALAEAIEKGIISKDKDGIILNADIFTNADVTRAYNALTTLPDAAIVIPYVPFGPERSRSFGLIGIEKDAEGNGQIKAFVEKPLYITGIPDAPKRSDFKTDEEFDKAIEKHEVEIAKLPGAEKAHDSENDKYYANPGIYIMSKEALGVLEELKDKAGLGNNVVPEIVKRCNEGTLISKKTGRSMKAYTVPLQRADGQIAFWDDIGTAEAYMKVMREVAYETSTKGTGTDNKFYGVPASILSSITDNVDLKTGIIYQTKDCRKGFESFMEKYDVSDAKGNIMVVD